MNDKVGKVKYRYEGSFFYSKKIQKKAIKNGDEFWAFPYDIPESFKDTIIPIDESHLTAKSEDTSVEEDQLQKEAKDVLVTYMIEQASGPGWFNVVDSNGKQLNEKALRKTDAETMVKQLSEIKG